MGNLLFGSTHAEAQPGKLLSGEGCVHEYDRQLRVNNVPEPDHLLGTVHPLFAPPINRPAEAEDSDK